MGEQYHFVRACLSLSIFVFSNRVQRLAHCDIEVSCRGVLPYFFLIYSM